MGFKGSTIVDHRYDEQNDLVISHRKNLIPRDEWHMVRVENAGIMFEVQVNPKSSQIEDVAFNGEVPTELEAVLERFCLLIIGLPILEASDHGVARLELFLRGNTLPLPVRGILIPRAVDQRFGLLQDLMRNLLSEYRHIAGYSDHENYFDIGAGQQWLDYADQERREIVEAVCVSTLNKMGLDPTEIEILEIEYDVRILVRLSGTLAKLETDKQALLMYLESAITEKIDSRLEV